jgi:hypothetical protein
MNLKTEVTLVSEILAAIRGARSALQVVLQAQVMAASLSFYSPVEICQFCNAAFYKLQELHCNSNFH